MSSPVQFPSENKTPYKLLAGFYNKEKRRENVLQKFQEKLAIFEATDFTCEQPESRDDVVKVIVKSEDEIQQEINDLEASIKSHKFDGHFTRVYRTFEGTGLKLLQTVDNLDLQKDPEKRKWRNDAVVVIQTILGFLESKVHEDGKCCKECELYGTMWQ